jgi:hypothetical protein
MICGDLRRASTPKKSRIPIFFMESGRLGNLLPDLAQEPRLAYTLVWSAVRGGSCKVWAASASDNPGPTTVRWRLRGEPEATSGGVVTFDGAIRGSDGGGAGSVVDHGDRRRGRTNQRTGSQMGIFHETQAISTYAIHVSTTIATRRFITRIPERSCYDWRTRRSYWAEPC